MQVWSRCKAKEVTQSSWGSSREVRTALAEHACPLQQVSDVVLEQKITL